MPLSADEKLIIARLIAAKANVLFGKFTKILTCQMKQREWQNIVHTCREVYGFDPIPHGKDWKHLRDKMWSSWRCSVLAKQKDLSESNHQPAEEVVFTEFELIVLRILKGEPVPIINNGMPPPPMKRSSDDLLQQPYCAVLDPNAAAITYADPNMSSSSSDDNDNEEIRWNLKLQNELLKARIEYLRVKTELMKTEIVKRRRHRRNYGHDVDDE